MSEFNQKPFLISGKASTYVGETGYSVYLDINNKSRLEGFYFECPKEDELFNLFEELATSLERAPLSKITSLVDSWKERHEDFFSKKIINIPEYLFELALSDYEGRNHNYESLSSKLSGKLICRCFGVSELQISDIVKANPKADLLYVADQLKASIGCGSCREDVIEAISKVKNNILIKEDKVLDSKFDKDGNRVRPLGLAPSEFVIKVDDLKRKWMKEQELDKYTIVILSVSGHTVVFKILPNENSRYILDTFHEYAESKLGITLRFDLFI
ncbi:(2Fe-2S)-binding protein [Halobacteriovorax sp.]|uniref:(2Fe-2S)-binding protein n=1 Tax=Halobacteriovorax sp. TaxID=2020862 RepID=UPI003566BC6F